MRKNLTLLILWHEKIYDLDIRDYHGAVFS